MRTEIDKFYAKENSTDMVYECKEADVEDRYMRLNLYLVGKIENGKYVCATDEEKDGDKGYEVVICYFFVEGIEEALDESDFEIVALKNLI